MTPQSPRQPAEVLAAIVANLEMCRGAAEHREKVAIRDGLKFAAIDSGAARSAFSEAIALIRTEAASLLTVTP